MNPGNILDSAKRMSAVFLFEWSEPQYLEASFQRISTRSKIPNGKVVRFTMQGERRWTHHERADSLLPAYRVQWALAIGNEEITLRTSGESHEP